VITLIREDRKWKVLALPPPTASGRDDDWIELVESTVERAWDRWCYAQQHAVRAARVRTKPQLALAVAQAAWNNYWLLLQDAERIKERLSVGRGRLAGGTFAAPRI